ncbi:MAG TPA: hypothetical protein VGL04_05875, partial [Sporichthyaceae bacterium]
MSTRFRKVALAAILAAPISLVLGHGPANAADIASVATVPAHHAPAGHGAGASATPSAGTPDPGAGMGAAPADGFGGDPTAQSDSTDPGQPGDPGSMPGEGDSDSSFPGGAGGGSMAANPTGAP